MCAAVDEMCQDARNEGIEIGTRKGIEIGILKRNQMIEKLIMEEMSDAFIMRIADISEEELKKIKLHT